MFVFTLAFVIIFVDPSIFENTQRRKFGTHDVIDVLPTRSLLILISKFSARAMHLPKQISLANATGLPFSMLTASYNHFSILQLKPLQSKPHYIWGRKFRQN